MRRPHKSCFVCGKASMQRNLVSHSHHVSKRHAKANLRLMRIHTGGAVRAVWICMKCLKKGSTTPALARRVTRVSSAKE